MPPRPPQAHELHPHPATPCAAVAALVVQVAQDAPALHLRYTLTGALDQLRIPAPAPRPRAADGLWRHTCFEAFIGTPDGARYHEFNFAPSLDWAGYAFSAERVRDAARAPLPAPRTACALDGDRLTLDAWLPWAALPPTPTAWRLGLTTVLESATGVLSYWALHHPVARPDFHHPAGWTVPLPAAENLNQNV